VVIGVIVAVICWTIPSILVRRNYYKITNYRIDYEHGFLFKTMDTLELWHVDDVSLRQSPIDRVFRVGTISIVSSDATNPTLRLRSIDEPRKLLETLKARIIAVKRQRGVVKLDM
jgi:membrane protein YdbS with pleckstrin-like domain